jgi:hypothetical protein
MVLWDRLLARALKGRMSQSNVKKMQPKPHAHAELVLVTPALATEYLRRNNQNRPLSMAYVEKLVVEMDEGRWQLTNQGIGFSRNGDLVDGQHRLKAVEVSGRAQWFYVFHDLDNNAFRVIDQNRKRSVAQMLTRMTDAKNVNIVAATANQMMQRFTMTAFPKEVILNFTVDNLVLISRITGVLNSGNSKMMRRAGVSAAFCNAVRLGQHPVAVIDALAYRLAHENWLPPQTGRGAKIKEDPMKVLNQRFVTDAQAQIGNKKAAIRAAYVYGLTVTAIQRALAGEFITETQLKESLTDWGNG